MPIAMSVFTRKQLEERETRLTKAVGQRRALELQETGPLVAKRQRRKLLYGLSLLLVVLGLLGAMLELGITNHWFSPGSANNQAVQRALHPDVSLSYSSEVTNTANLFMGEMLRKNWPGLWGMLAPDAQRLWQSEQAFTHFEQTKFGALNLQSYTLGQASISHPWLDPDTTQIYDSATTLQIALRASAPSGLLTAPSNQELNRGLFQHTLFALIQDKSASNAWKVLIAGPADPEAPVLVPAKPPVTRLILPIFMYHHVSSLPTHNLLDFNLTVTTADFEAQLTWLQQQGYHSITMTDLFDLFYYGKALPSKPMMLTFDDGYEDVYTYALPVLLAHHYRGVFYIITGMIGGRYVTWDQVRTMARSGMQIASHTVHHINIGEPPAGTTTQKELLDSKAKLEAELHEPIQFFCYPTGEPFHHDTVYEQQLVLKDLFEDGYLSATLDPSVFDSALQNSQTPYQLPRIRVSGGESLTAFEGILAATLQADRQRLAQLPKTP
jgi:peptidoglycan/xylan/chitin deacetylase (PgdA/CDA1 family)